MNPSKSTNGTDTPTPRLNPRLLCDVLPPVVGEMRTLYTPAPPMRYGLTNGTGSRWTGTTILAVNPSTRASALKPPCGFVAGKLTFLLPNPLYATSARTLNGTTGSPMPTEPVTL